jgi:hypothetical protein
MSVWDESATLAGIKIGRAQFIEEPNEFGSGPARAATRYHQRFAGRPNNVRCPLHRGRVGKDNRVRLALEMLVEQQGMREFVTQCICGEVEIDWTGLPAFAKSACHRFIELLQDQR